VNNAFYINRSNGKVSFALPLDGYSQSGHKHDASEIISGIISSDRLPAMSAAWGSIMGKPTTRDGYGLTDVYNINDTNSLLASKSNTGHSHDASEIISGILNSARIPVQTWVSIANKPDLYSVQDVNSLLNGKVSNGRTITINGVTQDLNDNRSWSVSGGISGSGSNNRLAKWSGSNLTDSRIYDSGSGTLEI